MRKIYVALLSSLLFFTLNTKLNAQTVGTYVFSPSAGTYTPLAGTTASTATGDDGTQNVAIGFNFIFGGVTYTNAVISTNGAIKLVTDGTTGFAASWTNNLSNTYNAAIVGPMWDDNNATGGSVVYLATGTAPNRTFSVEWINIHLGGGGSTTTPTGTFQLTLTESSNSIKFVYGTINPLTGSSIGIGLNDLASFISITPGTPATASSVTANNGITSATNLTSGTTYTFLTPPPCVAPPGGGTTTGPAGTVCQGVPFLLSVTGSSFGTGLTYQWEFSPDNSSWLPVPVGGTGITLTTSITATTYFRRKITCSGIDGFSSGLLIPVSPSVATPFTEDFAAYATTFPPACWTRSSTTAILGVAQSAFGTGGGSAKFDFYNTSSGNLDLATATFAAVPANHRLTFDHAYATYLNGENDQLQILYSTNGGTSYTNLILYDGGFTGPLNTGGSSGAPFTPTAAQWASKAISLPVGTNKILFRGVSAFGNNLFIDNVTVEPIPPCLPPTGLTVGAMAPTSATLNWTASTSNPPAYVCEVRTSGAPGTGGVGYVTQDTVVVGVTSMITGLTPNTTYSYYVQSLCGGGVVSTWAGAFVFTTPCNPVATPITETFTSYATTFPPTCWTSNNASLLKGNAASAYGAGTGSAQFDFYNAGTGTNLDLVSPLFTPVPANHRLVFDHAYATFTGEVDQLQIFYSTDGGATYISLITYTGGNSGPLNTGGAAGNPFTPNASQWDEKAVDLPVGTNRIRFRGVSAFGNNLYLDNIIVQPTPSCLAPTGLVKALAISPTTVLVSFNSPGTAFVVEYGAPGFAPGTTNIPGVGGTVVFGGSSPVTITGLTASTTYDFYVRRICIPGVDYSSNKKATATTLCPATTIPYLQTFESAVVPAMPTCTSAQDVNGNSGSFWLGTGGGSWETYTDANPLTYVSPGKSLLYYYDFNNLTRPADDWFYTQGLNLTAGTSYRLKFFYKGLNGASFPEKLEVKYGTSAYAANMTTGTLFTNNNITSTYGQARFDSAEVDFTPPATGTYYLGFHAFSNADELGLLLDDILVKPTPLVDVGITNLTLPSLTCPTNGVIMQATIRNYNITPLNFATNPVTVTANITGAATGTASTVLNAGTLAPGASISIYLSPAFNFSAAGIYNITTATSSPDDPEPGNNAYTTTRNVNPNPLVPVISPSTPQLCLGNIAQLTVPVPSNINTSVAAASTAPVSIPDNTPAGTSSTLAITGIPSTATITGISVTLNINHTWVNDIVVNLKAPNGGILNLFNRKGADGQANMVNTVINSTSTIAIPATGAPFTGVYMPDATIGIGPATALSNTAGFANLYSVPNGNWELGLRDYALFDAGTLTSWSITITYNYIPPLTWTPVTNLFTNAAATTAYAAGTSTYSVYFKSGSAGATTYTATATGAGGCTSTGTATVTVNAPSAITVGSIPDTVCISDQVISLVASPAGGSWTGIGVSGSNFIPPATAVGSFTLTYTYANGFGCTTTATKRITVKDCPERNILLSNNALFLYPNPNNGLFNIRINSALYNFLNMRVFTNNGVLVRTQPLNGLVYGRVVPIDLSNLPGGVYLVKFYYEGGVATSEKTFKVIIGLP